MAKKRRKKNGHDEGEIFYRAHPIAPAVPRVTSVATVSLGIELLLWRLLAVVEVVLLARLVLAAVGADGGNILSSIMYAISYPFVVFFFFLFNSLGSLNVTGPRFELETLAAMAFYYIIIYIVTQLIEALRPSSND